MKRVFVTLSMVLVLAVLAGCSTVLLSASAKETVEKDIPLPQGASFSLENVNGPVRVTVGKDGTVHLRAVKKVRAVDDAKAKEMLPSLEILVSSSSDGVKVETKYPKMKNRFFGGGYAMSVAYTVEVPRATALDLTSVNGELTINAPGSSVSCETTNGAIRVSAAGVLSAATVNGKIRFTADHAKDISTTNGGIDGRILSLKPDSAKLDTVNGGITVALAEKAACRIQAENVNGSVSTSLQGLTSSKHSLRGNLNGGGAVVQIETVNGSVKVVGGAEKR
jgi:DUF4097 and DUF4098 domain-containing protein YvlB